jgi:predicted DNA-binding antitoxin AbrB/MazE fold protein
VATETIEAVYEDGSFHPIAPVGITFSEGQKVRLVIERIEKPDDILALAAQVYEGLSDEQIDSIEQHSRRRENFFGERPTLKFIKCAKVPKVRK